MLFYTIENVVEKEDMLDIVFILFVECFQMTSSQRSLNLVIVW